MKFKQALFTLFFAAALTLAQGPQCKKPTPPPPTPPPPPVVNPQPTPGPVSVNTTNTNTNVNTNTSTSTSTSTASSNQTQSQNQTANGGNANASNGSQTINDNQVRQAPPATAPLVLPTANCLGAFSGGASAPVGGLSIGGSKVDKECRMQALANEFIGMGNYEAAAKVLCATKSAKAAKLAIEDCRAIIPKPVPVPTAPIVVIVPQQATATVPLPAPVPPITLHQEFVVTPRGMREVTPGTTKPTAKKAVKKPCPTVEK